MPLMEILSLDNLIILSSVFLSSLLGSLHCVGMCGPIALLIGKNFDSLLLYHLGRLIGYIILGLIAGLLSTQLIGYFPHSWIAIISPLSLAIVFLFMGIRIIQGKGFHLNLPSFLSKLFSASVEMKNKNFIGPFFVGLFSFTLPCGWLYGVVLGTLTTNNPVMSAAMMFAFWLGGLPVLLAAPWLLKKYITPFIQKRPYIGGSIFIMASIALIIQILIRKVS